MESEWFAELPMGSAVKTGYSVGGDLPSGDQKTFDRALIS
jgi:hypothetical protein